MRPIAAVTLIILGSAFAITVSLTAVIIIVYILGAEHPRLQNEAGALSTSVVIFTALTAVSAMSFYTYIKTLKGRYWSQILMWLSLLAIGWYYWPDS